MQILKLFFLSIVFCVANTQLIAQKTVVVQSHQKDIITAENLFDNQKYAAAQKIFISIAENKSYVESERIDASYYTALCAMRLFNSDAEFLLSSFISKFPESPRIYSAYFEMGNFMYREQKYEEAIPWYDKVDIRNFSNKEVAEFFYKKGYSYYKVKQFAKAKPLFREVKDSESIYAENALFYYSYLEYLDKNYSSALPGFESMRDSSMFSTVVPPYICQIYYVYGEYDKLIQYARKIEGVVNPGQIGDVYRVLAGAYYQTLQYDLALPYFEKYMAKAVNPSKSDYYELGYLNYRVGKYKNAIKYFQNVTSENDTLAQSAYYHLGDCYIKTKDKDKARNAFRAAMNYNVFPEINEDASFIHAKLIYELSYAPFNEAITAMQSFIKQYPQSKYNNEANQLLVKIFMSSKNYKDALESLEEITVYTTDLKIAYQQIAYYRGLELFNNHDYEQAITLFDKSLHYGIFDKTIKSFCNYWKAESNYKLKKYVHARELFNDFLLTPGNFDTDEYLRAHYNIAYTYFEEKDYSSAAVWFRKFIDASKNKSTNFYSDAAIRAGDCYYMLKDFSQAVRFYEKAVKSGQFDTEYALYQQAYCEGLVGNHNVKIKLLDTFKSKYPSSAYYDDAVFEQAEAYVTVGNQEQAIKNYNVIIENYSSSPNIKKALIQVAIIVYESGKLDDALIMYKRVVEKYPGSPEAQTAMNMIQNIYRKKSDVNSYFEYVQNLGGYVTIPEAEQDSLTFEVAQEVYLTGDCDKAQPLLKGYVQKFGEGFFVLPVHFYIAECYFNGGYGFEALQDYQFVLDQTQNEFTERSLVRAAQISVEAKQYDKASDYFLALEKIAELKPNLLYARAGLVQCYDELHEYKELVGIAETFVVMEKVSEDEKRWANMKMARAYDSLQDTAKALVKYRTVAIDYTTVEGAEARYRLAEILYKQGLYSESEIEIRKFLEKNTPHQYWLGKAYVLWAEVFIARDELFQARYTLQHVLEHYEVQDDGIIEKTNTLLNYITDIEMKAASVEEAPVNVPMDEENQDLFEKPVENK